MSERDDTSVTYSSGNVFADLGFPDAEEHLLKARLVHRLSEAMTQGEWTLKEAAALFGITKPELAEVLKGRFRKYSAWVLMEMLTKLDYGIIVSAQDLSRDDPPEALFNTYRPNPNRNADLSEDEAMALATEAVAQHRAERRHEASIDHSQEDFDGQSINLALDDDGQWLAYLIDWPSVSAFADTPEVAVSELRTAWALVKESYEEAGEPVPVAPTNKNYSGQFNVRIDKRIQRALAVEAAQAGISLNALVAQKLAKDARG